MIYPICSQPGVYIFADCAENWLNKTVQISSNPFLILSNFFPHSPKNPQTLDRAQGRWRDAPRSAAARAETFQAIGTGTGGTSFCAGGIEGRAEWEDGDEIMGKMDQWRGWSNNELRWGYRADFILSFLVWNYLPWPLGFRREGCDIYGARLETNFWHIHRKIIFQGGCLLGHWLQSSNWSVWLHACLRSMKTSCHVQQAVSTCVDPG